MHRFIAFLLVAAFANTATAQDNPNTILVLDGSGSMWGQIGGVAKITIAQDVIGGLMDTIPADQNIGLTVYGHRARGDCSDIETIVAPGPDTRDAIRNAVNKIKPLGKTPMTDSIIAAAEALRYTEDRATVILVSDGVETCNPDPCAAMRLLEEAAIDFTAHVVGFDVGSDAVALQQMQCIADETGGQFLTADNAEELVAALQTVAAEPEPIIISMTFTAVIGDEKRLIETPVLWDINADAGTIGKDMQDNPLSREIPKGSYVATAYSLELEQTVTVDFVVEDGSNTAVEAVFEEPQETATLNAPDAAPKGSEVAVSWKGPDNEGDYIAVALPGGNYINYANTRDGATVMLQMPTDPGDFEIQYIMRQGSTILATLPITVTELEVRVVAQETAPVGSNVSVGWEGPNYEGDFISVAEPGGNYINYAPTSGGNPVDLQMPTEPGSYEIRYQLRQDSKVIATQSIEIVPLEVSVNASTNAPAGSMVAVNWSGPDYEGDYISVGEPGGNYINYTATQDGNPLQLQMPATPGDYEIRYHLRQDSEILATKPITVYALKPEMSLPETAIAGAEISVTWDGPDYGGDYIAVGQPGNSQYINYSSTSDGSPLNLQMPAVAGDYEVRYVLRQDSTVILRKPISISPLKAQLVAESVAAPGGEIAVGWDGPDYEGDYISIATPDSASYSTYANTRDGNPATLRVPEAAGDYEIRYVLRQDSTIAARIPLKVE